MGDGWWALNRSVRFNPQQIRKTRPSIVLPKMIIFGKRPCRRRLEPGALSAGSGVDMATQEPPWGGKIEAPAVTRSHTRLDTTKPSTEDTSKRLQNSKRWKAAWYFILSNSMFRSRLAVLQQREKWGVVVVGVDRQKSSLVWIRFTSLVYMYIFERPHWCMLKRDRPTRNLNLAEGSAAEGSLLLEACRMIARQGREASFQKCGKAFGIGTRRRKKRSA